MIPASSSGRRIRDLEFSARVILQRSGERRGVVAAATAAVRRLRAADVVRIPVATRNLAPGYYLVTRVFGGEVWLAWVAGAAVHSDVVAERFPGGLSVASEQVCWFWDEVPSGRQVGLDADPEEPLEVPLPRWLQEDGLEVLTGGDVPMTVLLGTRAVPVTLGCAVYARTDAVWARVIQALEAGADPLPVAEWALARRRGAGLGAAEDLGAEVHGQVEIEVFLPRRSWVRRRVAESPPDVVRRMAEPGATPDAVFTLVGDDRRTTP
jgi:hypothetical protein